MTVTVAEGESVAIVGESGSGKSTLLRVVAGLERADRGAVVLGHAKARPQMVFQDAGASLTPWLTVGALIGERLRHESLHEAQKRDKVDEALTHVGLPVHVANAKAAELSGGQRQRVALARATVVPPEVLLCDEPTSALDVSLAAVVLNLIARLRAELGMAVLFVTHDLAVARVVADRIAVMYLGRLVEIGPAEDVVASPQHPYTKALVGAVPDVGRDARGAARRARQPAQPAPRLLLPPAVPGRRDGVRRPPLRPAPDQRHRAPPRGVRPRGPARSGGELTMAVAEPYTPPGTAAPRRWRPGAPRAGNSRGRIASRARKRDIAAASLLVIITLIALLAPVLAPYSTIQPAGLPQLPPGSSGFLLGTDAIGRDVLSRVLIGWRSSWFAALAVIASGLFIGGLIGLVSGTLAGVTDTTLMRITDGFLALPAPVLAIAVVAALGPGFDHTLIAVAIVWWPFYARIVRGEIRSLSSETPRGGGKTGRRRTRTDRP